MIKMNKKIFDRPSMARKNGFTTQLCDDVRFYIAEDKKTNIVYLIKRGRVIKHGLHIKEQDNRFVTTLFNGKLWYTDK